MSPPPDERPTGWGAPSEPNERDDDGSGVDDAPRRPAAWGAADEPTTLVPDRRRRAPSPGMSGGVSLITLAFGLVALAFGLWTIARRWKAISEGIDLHRMSSGTREAAAQLNQLTGVPTTGLDDALLPYESLALPTITGGVIGLIAGAMFVAIGAAVLLKSGLAVQLGARGLLVAAGTFTLSHVCDIWAGSRLIDIREEMIERMRAQLGGSDRVRAAIANAYESMTAVQTPSMSDFVVDALVWIVPVVIVAVWGSRHLDSPETRASLGH